MNTPNQTPAEAMAHVADMFGLALSAATGIREQALRDGYNETAAEQIAVATYAAIIGGVNR